MKRELRKNKQKGFIALISAIIISVLLLTVTVGIGMTGIFSRLNVLDSESKERSSALAEACADTAILKLAQNSGYNPVNECNPVGDTCLNGPNVCTVVSVTNNNTTIKTQAHINRAYTNLTVVIDNNYNVVSWDETPN